MRTLTTTTSPGRAITMVAHGRRNRQLTRRPLRSRRLRQLNWPARNTTIPREAGGASLAAASAVPHAAAFPDATPGHLATARLAHESRGDWAHLSHS